MPSPSPQSVDVPTPDGPMPAKVWLPEGGSGPGLVLVQEIFGVSAYIQSRAADLATLGYVVLAPELYWRLPDRSIDDTRDDVLSQGMALAGQIDWDTAVSDAGCALTDLRGRPDVTGGVGLIGFCFGGGLAFAVAALHPVDVLISYYGSALPGLLHLSPQVTAPSLHHFGLADAFIGAEQVQRIRESVTTSPKVVFRTYAGANHAFDNPELPDLYHPQASAEAWSSTVDFLRTHLPVTAL